MNMKEQIKWFLRKPVRECLTQDYCVVPTQGGQLSGILWNVRPLSALQTGEVPAKEDDLITLYTAGSVAEWGLQC